MNRIEMLLESIAEALKLKRRYGPRFPTPWDLSRVTYNVEESRLELDLWLDGKVFKYDLLLRSVKEHGDESKLVLEKELVNGSDG